MGSLLKKGYRIVYNKTYSHSTTYEELKSINESCKLQSTICVGETNKSNSDSINLISCGNCQSIMKETKKNSPKLVNGAYWYFNSLSFGFAPNSIINQENCDTYDSENNERLCWNLYNSKKRDSIVQAGGWRLGTKRNLDYDDEHLKYVFFNEGPESTTVAQTTSIAYEINNLTQDYLTASMSSIEISSPTESILILTSKMRSSATSSTLIHSTSSSSTTLFSTATLASVLTTKYTSTSVTTNPLTKKATLITTGSSILTLVATTTLVSNGFVYTTDTKSTSFTSTTSTLISTSLRGTSSILTTLSSSLNATSTLKTTSLINAISASMSAASEIFLSTTNINPTTSSYKSRNTNNISNRNDRIRKNSSPKSS